MIHQTIDTATRVDFLQVIRLRELVERWREEANALCQPHGYGIAKRQDANELAAILSRATPSDNSFASDLVNEGLDYFYKTGDDGDKEYVRAIRAHIAALEKTSAPRVVTDAHPSTYRWRRHGRDDWKYAEWIPISDEETAEMVKRGWDVEVFYSRAAIESFATSLPAGVPDGWKLVPVEPTYLMKNNATEAFHGLSMVGSATVYKAMLAAAPQAGERG